MKTRNIAVAGILVFLIGSAQAALINSGGGLIYDSDLNVTWLQDANLAATNTFGVSGIASDGSMNWNTSQRWIAAMNLANYKGYSDWRLPVIGPINQDFDFSGSFDGSTDYGYNNTSINSELAYLFYVELGNRGLYDTAGNFQSGYGLVDDPLNPSDENLFNNIYCSSSSYFCPTYWSGTRWQNPAFPTIMAAWVFDMSIGAQSGDYDTKLYRAWAVRDGGAVPEPTTVTLLCIALAGLGATRHSKQKSA